MASTLPTITRWILVASQVWTLVLTWPLWRCREDIPLVHRVSLPDWDAGPLIVATLALILVPDVLRILDRILTSTSSGRRLRAPAAWLPTAVALHALSLGFAMLQDELRVQPQVITPALLLFSTLPGRGALLFGSAVLASMWGWAGAHKLLSAGYVNGFGRSVVGALFPALSDTGIAVISKGLAAGELAMAVALLLPVVRRTPLRFGLVAAALGLHGGILVSLILLDHNPSVLPWNAGSAVAAASIVLASRHSPVALLRGSPWIARLGAAALIVVPAGYPLGWTHPYFSFALYANNTPQAVVQLSPTQEVPLRYIQSFESFIPPTRRNFEAIFLHRCRPGHRLVITDPRACARRQGWDRVVVPCPSGARR